MIEINKTYLLSTSEWFFAPNGKQYSAVFGTVKGIHQDTALGIKTNRGSTNWYVEIGNMVIAGCQLHYVVQCESCEFGDVEHNEWGNGEHVTYDRSSSIYNADIKY